MKDGSRCASDLELIEKKEERVRERERERYLIEKKEDKKEQ